jgi:arylsulfatase A-like enzyme
MRSIRALPALLPLALLAALPAAAPAAAEHRSPPNVLLVTIDTLRADRMSGYGYHRPTTPHLDRLIAGGARFDEARTVEPLTSPASCSMLTSLYPHEHGSTRNGLRLRHGLPSLPKELDRFGYQTAGFVANWTIKDKMSGLGEHFQVYDEVLTKKRWFGLVAGEATAEDINAAAFVWMDEHAGRRRPFFLWLHYVEPHAPYEFQGEVAARVGVRRRAKADKSDRYDTEVAYVDHHVGQVLDRVAGDPKLAGNTLIVFLSDHGEAFGEHGYWGHGRRLHDPGLHIPMVVYWPGKVPRQRIGAPASILDVAPTVLGLLGHPVPAGYRGVDWSGVLTGRARPDPGRTLWFQAHKGAVLDINESVDARRDGLMALGMLAGGRKEIVQVNREEHRIFDLRRDPRELHDLNGAGYQPSPELQGWIEHVEEALSHSHDAPPAALDAEDVEKLKSLGYVDR